jgi:hypothetical protein
MSRRLIVVALALGAFLIVPVASANAATFAGACTVSGNANFGPSGLKATPQNLTYTFNSTGSCTGTLDGAAIVQAPVSANATGSGTLSCAAAVAPGGSGSITFTGQGVTIPFAVNLAGVGTEVAFTLTGGTGVAVGHASFAANAGRATECSSDTGIQSLGFDIQAAGTLIG